MSFGNIRLRRIWSACVCLLLSMTAATYAQTRVIYKPSNKNFPNPERGFFTPFPRPRDGSLTPLPPAERDSLSLSGMEAIRSKGESVVELDFNLHKFRHSKISKAELATIQHDFDLVREGGMKCLIRFAYSEAIGQPDAPLKIVLEQIAQLKPILQANYDVIAVMQAGFIGAWGEWHSSTNGLDNVVDRRKILFAELDALPKVRMIQVRTPHFKREIFDRRTPVTRSEAFNESKYSRVGEHNDCFLANWNDYGTYVDTTRGHNYIARDCLYVPMGGETCHVSKYCECGNAIYQMDRLHWSLLNWTWNPAVYKLWQKDGCLSEVKRRLGYRFELLSGVYSDSLKRGNAFQYSIKLTNLGFAPLFNPRDVEIILQNDANGRRYVADLPIDPRFWEPGDTLTVAGKIGIAHDIPNGTYSVYLNLPDPVPRLHFRPDYSIRLANRNVWEPRMGYNNLDTRLVINSETGGATYNGKVRFRPLRLPTSARERKAD